MNRMPTATLLGLLAIGLGGCAAPQMGRIEKNRDLYETWPIETRQAVLDGKVEPGMTPDMVKVSWGEPTKIVESNTAGEEIWVYEKGGSEGGMMDPTMGMPASPAAGIMIPQRGSSMNGPAALGGGGIGAATPIYVPPTPAEVREVVFRDGVVHRADQPAP